MFEDPPFRDGKSFRIVEGKDKHDALLMIGARVMLVAYPRFRPSPLARACGGGEPRVTRGMEYQMLLRWRSPLALDS